MEYKYLGNSGLKVSRIAFGNWLNSDDPKNKEIICDMVQKAYSYGINFFDTAEIYGFGEAERQFAEAIKKLDVPREQIVLSTKLYFGPQKMANPNALGLSRKHVVEGIKASLKRLEQDYVDIVFCHRFDYDTPLEEVCRAFDWVIKQGYAHYWGTSEWSAANIFEAFMICEKHNLVKPIADQCQYNMMVREKMEKDFIRLFDNYKYGTTVYSPLLGGLLTGKYNDGIPDETRMTRFGNQSWAKPLQEKYFGEANKAKYQKLFKDLAELAKELGITQAQLALAWVLAYDNTSTAIVGATKPEQLEETIKAMQAKDKITKEVIEKLDALLESAPEPEANPKAWG